MSPEAVDLTAQNLAGFYPLNRNQAAVGSGPDDQKFLDLVNNYPGDIRWMFTEISNKTPSAADIIRRDLNRMITDDLTPQEAAKNLQDGLGEWYAPAQSCK
jgi:raffinose/stachyose/melibiose transport system substrate-binding protein